MTYGDAMMTDVNTGVWMSREEIAQALGIVPNSVRGKVQKGQIERKVEDGKNFYRVADLEKAKPRTVVKETAAPPPPPAPIAVAIREPEPSPVQPQEPRKSATGGPFDPKKILLEQMASIKVGRNIDAIEKGDEIDLATEEISRELDARITMRQHRQLKEIEDALERVRLGEYGMCEECGEHIPEQRLRLFPAARLCVRCQEEMDHYEKLRESQGPRSGTWREDSGEGGYTKTFED